MFGAILGGIVGGMLLGGKKDEPQQAADPVYNASSGQTGASGNRMVGEGGDSELTNNSMTSGVKSINAQIGGGDNKYAEMYYNKPQIQRRERALTSFN